MSIDVNKFINAEWKDKHSDKRFLFSYNDSNAKIKDNPILLIGIGGTGIESVMRVKQKVERSFSREESGKVGYLFVDTDEMPDSADVEQGDKLIIQSADTARFLRECKEREQCGNKHAYPREIDSWIDKEMSPFKVMNGAAGIRQAGRLILFLNIQEVYNVLEKKINKLCIDYDSSKVMLSVYIFMGIGGGTGSGMFVDISYLIQRIYEYADVHGIVFMPDVSCMKQGLKKITKDNIYRNGFAALKEIEHLMMLERYSEYFKQEYPGTIGTIRTQNPVFSHCIFVGSKERGRKAIKSEAEIYLRVANYMLFELQAKSVNGFDLNSFKSNLVCKEKSKVAHFDKYISVGTKTKNIQVDYYFSQWLYDVFQQYKERVEIKEGIIGESRFIGQFDEIMKLKKKDRRKKIEESKKNKSIIYDPMIYAMISSESDMLSAISERYMKQLVMRTKYKIFPKIRVYIRSYLKVRDTCKMFCEVYNAEFSNGRQDANLIKTILTDIAKRCEEYIYLDPEDNAILDDCLLSDVTKTAEYRKSITDALNYLLKDLVINKKRWIGKNDQNDEFIWLSDHVARELHNIFKSSKCCELYSLFAVYQDGTQARVGHLEDILNEINETAQMWPTTSTVDIRSYDEYEVIGITNDNWILSVADKWLDARKCEGSILVSDIKGWFSKLLFVSGYELHNYNGIKDMEERYIFARNLKGCHLYAAPNKNWRKLSSPYIENCWNVEDKKVRKEEWERNKYYRDIFIKACGTECICWDKEERRYYFSGNYDDNTVLETASSSENGYEHIYIGDIADGPDIDDYNALAAEMFIHMFSWRDQVAAWVMHSYDNNDSHIGNE